MRISSEFNNFLHGVVLKEIHDLRYLKFAEQNIAIKPFYLSFDTLKQVLKILDLNYPRIKRKNGDFWVMSYTQINSKDLIQHLLFLEVILAENKITPKWLDDEIYKKEKQCLTK